MRVTLTKDELTKCKFFSLKCAENQQAIEFGQKTTKARDVKEIARDNLIGKIAETAFSRIMNNVESTFHWISIIIQEESGTAKMLLSTVGE